ncbi:MAG TPA: trigger factor [Lentisphaeria bacterium]|nr:trigger factor [Lentisphaeria bacterium]
MDITAPLPNVTRTDTEPCCFSLQIEVPAEQVKKAYGQALAKVAAKVRLPGFRPGKVPTAILVKQYGKEIEAETQELLINDSFKTALGQQKDKLALQAQLDHDSISAINQDAPFTYVVKCEAEPEFTLPEYKGVKLTRAAISVTDENVEEYLGNLLDSRARLQQVERPAELGDFLKVSYNATLPEDFEVGKNGEYLVKAENSWLGLREPELLPGTMQKLVGAEVGAEVSLDVTFPEDFREADFAGKTFPYVITVLEIQAAVRPELDDELAKSCHAENVEDLKKRVRDMIHTQKTKEREEELRNTLIEAIMAQVDFPLPPTIVEYNRENVIREIVRTQQRNGVSEEKIREGIKESMDRAEQIARQRTRFRYVIDAIADAEGIKVENEELSQQVSTMAMMSRSSLKKTVREMTQSGQLMQMADSIRSTKTIDRLMELADITEE